MSVPFHVINPIIRLKENDLLTKTTFDTMIATDTFAEISDLLMKTNYEKYLGPNFQFNIESILDQEMKDTTNELLDLGVSAEIVWVFTMKYTFHNLKVLTKAEKIGENYDELFISDGFYRLEDVKSAVQSGISGVLPRNVMTTIKEVNAYFEESAVLQGIDVIYDRHYLREQRQLAQKINDPILLEAILEMIDFTNIITTARCLLQKRTVGFLSTVLSSYGSIPKTEFLDQIGGSIGGFEDFLRRSYLSDKLEPALKENEIDFLKLDLIKENVLTFAFSVAQTEAFGPLPVLRYLYAKEIEMTNLRLIVVGKRSGFSTGQIYERMREICEL